eukprot:10941.XXX_250311_249084_1 [CDS] Oithona nana genome sequencing.
MTMIVLIWVISLLSYSFYAQGVDSNKYDVIFFVQDWPISDCIDWQRNSGGRCSIKDYHRWTIRGIHTGRRDGKPVQQFCDTKPLQLTKLRPLIANLTLEWTSDHANPGQDTFWSFIWYKYGSCFQALASLHDPHEYFMKALQWHNEFPAEKFLGKHLILPGKEYFVEDIHWAIKDELYGKIPAIDCDHSNETLKPTILSKITLCFNLKLQLIHCRPKMFPQGIFGHCPRRSLVDYPKDADDISSWSKTVIGVGSLVGLLVLLWIVRVSYVKYRNYQPIITRGLTNGMLRSETMPASGMSVPFNIDIDDLIERYRALGGEI